MANVKIVNDNYEGETHEIPILELDDQRPEDYEVGQVMWLLQTEHPDVNRLPYVAFLECERLELIERNGEKWELTDLGKKVGYGDLIVTVCPLPALEPDVWKDIAYALGENPLCQHHQSIFELYTSFSNTSEMYPYPLKNAFRILPGDPADFNFAVLNIINRVESFR